MMLDCIGCTSNVIYIDKDQKKIFVANAGDSRCVLGRAGGAVEMSIDHKPEG
jgi:serine/threonine protein phosphatase PrpC